MIQTSSATQIARDRFGLGSRLLDLRFSLRLRLLEEAAWLQLNLDEGPSDTGEVSLLTTASFPGRESGAWTALGMCDIDVRASWDILVSPGDDRLPFHAERVEFRQYENGQCHPREWARYLLGIFECPFAALDALAADMTRWQESQVERDQSALIQSAQKEDRALAALGC
jgi:hypothetical protein